VGITDTDREIHVGLVCTEMPEARFEDLLTVQLNSATARVLIDSRFMKVCNPDSIQIVGIVSEQPAIIGGTVVNRHVRVRVEDQWFKPGMSVTIRLSGIRKDRGERFKEFSAAEAESNLRFWASWQNE
jgi:hypothetical protein